MNMLSQIKLITKLTSFALLAVLLVIGSSCNEERLYPTPLPTNVSIKTLSFSRINGRIGGGDFEKDTLFQISGIPEDGVWNYIMDIGGYMQEGTINVVNSEAKFANFLRLDWWMALEDEDSDSITLTIELVSEVLGYEEGTFSCKFKKEMYDIRTWQDLQAMQYDLNGEYTLKNDIVFPEPVKDDFPEQGFLPIGGGKGINNAFTGKLLGDGYTIKDFCINREYTNFVGLFGVLSYTSEVKNLIIELSDLGVRGYDYVGALAGYADKNTLIEDCKAEGDVYGNDYTGGLVGYIGDNSIIRLSRMTGTVSGAAFTGGLIGCSSKGSNIEYCFSNVTVTGTDTIGGLIGAANGSISNCQGDSIVITGNSCVGGFLGWNGGILNNCSVAAGNVTGDSAVGGLAGYSGNTGGIYKSCSKANVSGNRIVGGFIGVNMGEVVNCYASGGQVKGSTVVGGLIGESHSLVKNCYTNSCTVNGTIAGGFIGDKNGTVSNCYWNQDVSSSLESVGNGDSFGIEEKTTALFTSFDPTIGGLREIFLGWDFMEIWIVLSSKNQGFPYLSIERGLSVNS